MFNKDSSDAKERVEDIQVSWYHGEDIIPKLETYFTEGWSLQGPG